MKNALATLSFSLVSLLPGCGYLDFTQGGIVPMNNTSQAIMDQSDFTIIATNLRGMASCPYVFGIPIGNADIFTQAMNQIVESAKLKDNGSRVLVNFAGDNTALNILGVYMIKTVTLRCDLAQFDK
jgi:hypothetical protein